MAGHLSGHLGPYRWGGTSLPCALLGSALAKQGDSAEQGALADPRRQCSPNWSWVASQMGLGFSLLAESRARLPLGPAWLPPCPSTTHHQSRNSLSPPPPSLPPSPPAHYASVSAGLGDADGAERRLSEAGVACSASLRGRAPMRGCHSVPPH